MDKFQGILFTLKKRKQYPDKPDKNFYDFTTFGYYDGLSVSCIEQWYQFRPAGIALTCGYVSQGAPFTDIYVIKGFFPDKGCIDDDWFDYSIWHKIGKKGSQGVVCKEAAKLLEAHPYICLSSVHLSQTFIEQFDGLEIITNEIKSYIKETAERENWNLREQHCAVFPIIGFSDYVIGFVSKDFRIPTYCISKLREWRIDDKAVISSCYTICGVYKDFQVTKDNFNGDSSKIILTETSYYNEENSNYSLANVLQAYSMNYCNLLYVGFSGADYTFRRIIRGMNKNGDKIKHYIFFCVDDILNMVYEGTDKKLAKSDFIEQLGKDEFAYEKLMINHIIVSKTLYWEDKGMNVIWSTLEELPRLLMSLHDDVVK
ncbi:MAG: SIR2 family protein [Ruminococcus flavefaciens]|nr:SIR2 family protein [Ruminococcus flavefaciens]